MFDLRPSTTPTTPRLDLHATRSSDGIVILDIIGDAYHSLYDPRSPDRRVDDAADRALVERSLDEAGLRDPTGGARQTVGWAATPSWRELPASGASRPPLRIVAAFLGALAGTCLRVRTRSFVQLVEAADRKFLNPYSATEEELARLVGWFDRLSLWLPVRPLCLFRSLMLLLFLRALDIDAQWIFGVTLFPFQAHCWLAIDDLLVGERADRVEEFAVIFATGSRLA